MISRSSASVSSNACRVLSTLLAGVLVFFSVVAHAQTSLVNEGTVEGSIDALGETDEFTFDVAAGESVHIRVVDTSGNLSFEPYIWLYAPDGSLVRTATDEEVAALDCYPTSGFCRLEQSGTFRLVVADSGNNGTGTYEIYYTRVSGANENGPLANEGTASGDIALGDIDVFTFDVTAGEAVHIRVVDTSGNLSFEPYIWLYGPDGSLIRTDTEEVVAELDCYPTSGTCRLEQAGTYRLVMTDYLNDGVGTYEVYYTRVSGANENGPLVNESTVSGDIALGDIDVFTFDVPAGESVHIRVVDTSGNLSFEPYIWLYGPDGSLIRTDTEEVVAELDCYPTSGTCRLEQAGVYRLVVTDYLNDGEGPYEIYYTRVSGASENGPLFNEGTVSGDIALGDIDVFTFDVTADEAVHIRVVDTSGDSSFEPYIWLYGPDGSLIRTDTEEVVAELDCYPTSGTCRLEQPGTYRLVVTDYLNDGVGTYEIYYTRVSGASENGPLFNEGTVNGDIALGDIDAFTFDVPAGESVHIRVVDTSGDSSFEPYIWLYGPDGSLIRTDTGEVVAELDCYRASGTCRLEQAGTYRLVVTDYLNDGVGTYEIYYTRVSGASENGPLFNEGTVNGDIALGDIDAFTFDVTAGEAVHIRVVDTSGDSSFEPYIWLYGPDGSLVRTDTEEVVAELDCYPTSGTCRLEQAGTYRLVLTDYLNDSAGAYEIYYTRVSGANENGPLVNESTVSGDIALGDIDVFTFDVTAGESAQIRVVDTSGNLSFEPYIWLYGPDGGLIRTDTDEVVAELDCYPTSGTCRLEQAGTYRLVVTDNLNNSGGTYEIEFTGPLQVCDPNLPVRGYVRDATANKAPLANVTIGANGVAAATSGSNGYFEIAGFNCTTFVASVNHSGYTSYLRTVDATNGGMLKIALTRDSTTNGLASDSGVYGDPVNTATGNYVYQSRDLSVAGIGLPIALDRTYNSRAASEASAVDGPLGYGWSHNYMARLNFDGSGNATITWGDGSTQTWADDGAGGFIPQYGVFDNLVDDGGGFYSLHKKDDTTYQFDSTGSLSAIGDRNGNSQNLSYTGTDLTQITDTTGRVFSLSYDASGHLTGLVDPIGRTLQYDYDGEGNLISATDPNGNVTIYTYDSSHQVLTVVDPRGNTVVSNTYDADNRVVTYQTDAKGGATSYSYESLDRVTTITDALGHVTTHHHDELLRLIKEVDALGHEASYEYDAAGNRVKVIDKNGNETNYGYDARGNVTQKTDALGQVTTITYDGDDNPLSRTDALGYVTQFQYDVSGNLLTTTDPLGNATNRTYNAQGQTLTLTDPKGNLTSYAYDTEGNQAAMTDALGQVTTHTYDGAARRLSSTDPLGRTTTYSYDANDNLLSVADPLGNSVTHSYDGNDNRLNTLDRNGNLTSFVYDEKDLLVSSTDPLGNVTTNTYDALDRKIAVTDARGNVTQYAFDAVGNLIQVTDPLGEAETYTYDPNGNQTTETDRNGNTSSTIYDALNRPIQVIDALGNSTVSAYDAVGRVITVTTAAGQVTTRAYDALGRVTAITDPRDETTQYTYDANGNRLSATDPRDATTTFAYDALDRQISATDALGNTSTTVYDAAGQVISVTDANGHTTTNAYDDLGRLIQVTDAAGGVFQTTYDANGNRLSTTDALGRTTTRVYDALDRVISVTDPAGAQVLTAYDAVGNRASHTDRNGNITTFVYDAANRRTQRTDALGNNWLTTYDAVGNRLTVTDPLDHVTTYAYDALNRRAEVIDALESTTITTYDEVGRAVATTNANGQITSFAYDAKNNLVQVTDAAGGVVLNTYDENGNRLTVTDPNGNTTSHVYDELNRLTQKTEPLGHVTAYAYDAVGNLVQRTDSKGQVAQYSYDALDRRTGIDYQSQSDVAFGYDAVGNLTQMTDGLGTTSHNYDNRDRRIGTTDPYGNVVAYGYDENGNRTSLTYPGNKTVNYGYDANDRLQSVTDWLGNTTVYGYDSAARLIQKTNANGTTAIYGYDDANRLTLLTNQKSDAGVISSYTYTLDAVGNHLSENRTEPLAPILPPATVTYSHDAENRLITSSAAANSFDANGNQTGKGSDTYTYDVENRLIQATRDGETSQYFYDGLGNRYAATRYGETMRYVLDTNTKLTNVLMETTDAGIPLAYNVYGQGLIARILPDDSALQYHYDSRGSVIAITNNAEVTTQAYVYDPFGQQLDAQGTTDTPFGYLGRYGVLDEGSALNFIRARYYDTDQQRFINKDRYLGEERNTQSINRYAYALNSPVRLVDVSGFSASEGVIRGSNNGSSDTDHSFMVDFLSNSSFDLQWAIAGTTPQLPSPCSAFGPHRYGCYSGPWYSAGAGKSAVASDPKGHAKVLMAVEPIDQWDRGAAFHDFNYADIDAANLSDSEENLAKLGADIALLQSCGLDCDTGVHGRFHQEMIALQAKIRFLLLWKEEFEEEFNEVFIATPYDAGVRAGMWLQNLWKGD